MASSAGSPPDHRVAPTSRDPRDAADAGSWITCVVESEPPVSVLRLAGDLDLSTAVLVRRQLHEVLSAQPAAIVIDLVGVMVLDDLVLTLFSAFTRAAAGWPGCAVLIYAPDQEMAEDLGRLGVTRSTPVYRDREQALIAARTIPAPLRFSWQLQSSPSAPAAARDLVAHACRTWELSQLIEEAELVVSELVSNAVRHAGGKLDLLVVRTDHLLHLSVRDNSTRPPWRTVRQEYLGEGGRGLTVVDVLTVNWGTTPVHGGKVIWATLRINR